MTDFILTGRLLFLRRAVVPMFLFNFNQLVQVGHLVETYKWHPGGLGFCCKEVSYFLLTKNRQEAGGEEGMEFNLAAEKEFTKLLPSCLIMKIMKKRNLPSRVTKPLSFYRQAGVHNLK